MEKFNRAVRRHHIARLKKTRAKYWGYHRYTKSIDALYARQEYVGVRGHSVMDPDQLGKVVQYPASCSCPGCGNSRKYYGMSLGEISFHALADELMKDL